MVWFWYQGNDGFIHWVGKSSFYWKMLCRIVTIISLNVWYNSPMKLSGLRNFFFWKALNHKLKFLNRYKIFRWSISPWVILVVFDFQRIDPFHLSCWIYGHKVFGSIPLLTFECVKVCSDALSFIADLVIWVFSGFSLSVCLEVYQSY